MPLGLRALALHPILTHPADNRPVPGVKGPAGPLGGARRPLAGAPADGPPVTTRTLAG